MTLIQTRRQQIFPLLTSAQIDVARGFSKSPVRHFEPDEVLYTVGERQAPVFVVIAGEVQIHRQHGSGRDELVAVLAVGGVTGEISQLSGHSTLAEARAGPSGCEFVGFDRTQLRSLIIGSADIGEIIMRAFILRRTALIAEGAGSVIAGRPGEPALARLEGVLSRNGYPYSVLDVTDNDEGHALVERFGLHDEDLPIVLCPNGTLLGIRPTLKRPPVWELRHSWIRRAFSTWRWWAQVQPVWLPRCMQHRRACRYWYSRCAFVWWAGGRVVTN